MNLYYVYGKRETMWHYIALAPTKEKAEELFKKKTGEECATHQTKRLQDGAYIVASTLIIDNES